MKILLWPFSQLYGWGVGLWLWLYEKGYSKRVSFNLPVISVGNLSVGGTGKTPHVAFIADFLDRYLEVAILSRGYGRKSLGFRFVEPDHPAEETGDEPLQLKRMLPETVVAVAENRMYAVPRILAAHPGTQVVLLDDAFQHLPVRPGLNLLLTEFRKPYFHDHLLPLGNLREPPAGAARADAIVVTKCPPDLTPERAAEFARELAPLPHQRVFFSALEYGEPYRLFAPTETMTLDPKLHALFVCGIASPDAAVEHLKNRCASVYLLSYPDHHFFEKGDVSKFVRAFRQLPDSPACILTTEKDAVRLEAHREYLTEQGVPIYVLPVRPRFLFEGDEAFFEYLKTWLLEFRS